MSAVPVPHCPALSAGTEEAPGLLRDRMADSGGRGKNGGRGRGGAKNNAANESWKKHQQFDYPLPKVDPQAARLTEDSVGITEYLSDHSGFGGVIKQRYSDFLVNEIDLEGNIVKLTNVEPPEDKKVETTEDVSIPDEQKVELPPETWDKLKLMSDGDETLESLEVEVTTLTKEERKRIHLAICKNFRKLQTSTQQKPDGKKCIVVKRQSAIDGYGLNRRVHWPKERGEYTHFVLSKENMDTMEAVNLIAIRLRIKANMFTYAGTKDRRARTCQQVSVPRVDAKRLADISKTIKRISMGNFSYKSSPIRLGDLQGNHFQIVLRNVCAPDEEIGRAADMLKERGFINYFGLQRFGSTVVPTHHIGRALLKSQWQQAVELILMPRDGENENLTEVRKFWWRTRNAPAAVKMMQHPDKSIEGKLLMGLSKHGPKNYIGALEMIPKNTRLMYIHAYQSYIWNVVASRRIKKFGLQPIEGDLVMKDVKAMEEDSAMEVNGDEIHSEKAQSSSSTTTAPLATLGSSNEVTSTTKTEEDGKCEPFPGEASAAPGSTPGSEPASSTLPDSSGGGASSSSSVACADTDPSSTTVDVGIPSSSGGGGAGTGRKRPVPKILGKDDLTGGSIDDIVLPLPGYDIQYPDNEMKDWYTALLAADSLQSSGLKQRVRTYSLGGTYRKMIVRPKNVTWRLMKYSDPQKQLVLADVDELNHMPPPESDQDGKYKALVVEFSLPSSTYATMALREILKADTSAAFQSSLNDYFKELPTTTPEPKTGARKADESGLEVGEADAPEEKRARVELAPDVEMS